MISIYKSFNFSHVGILAGDDTVLGFIRDQSHVTRTVAISLTAGLTGQRHKNKLSSLRENLSQTEVPSLQAWHKKLLSQFKSSAAIAGPTHMTAKIESPEYIPQTVEMVLNGTTQSHIIFDCRNKEAFYSMCRYLEIDEKTMFALAELEALKPQAKTVHQTKPAGDAHLLMKWLSRNEDSLGADILDKIQHSVKFRLPELDTYKDYLAAIFESDMNSLGKMRDRSLKKRWFGATYQDIQNIGTKLVASMGISPDEMLQAQKEIIARKGKKPSIESVPGIDGLTQLIGLEQVEKHTRSTWENHMGLPLEAIQFPHPVTHVGAGKNRNMVLRLRMRMGIYDLPYNTCLFEMDVINWDEKKRRLFVLAEQMDKGHIVFKPVFEGLDVHGYVPYNHCHLNYDHHGSFSWNVTHWETGDKIEQQDRDGLDYNEVTVAIISALNSISRMNEPGFERKTVIPTGGQVLKNLRHHSAYFEYHVIDQYPELYRAHSVGTVSTKGDESRGGYVRHLVRGHPRRLTHEDGSMDLIIVSPHARGDASKGFKMKSYDLSKR